jgi:hypothetical protein
MTTALDRAHAGAAFLDKRLGRGWRRKIKRRRLDMENPDYLLDNSASCGCILSQLDSYDGTRRGVYGHMCDVLGLEPSEERRLGFLAEEEDDWDGCYMSYGDLDVAWRTVLREG